MLIRVAHRSFLLRCGVDDNIRHGHNNVDGIYASQGIYWHCSQQFREKYIFLRRGHYRRTSHQSHWEWMAMHDHWSLCPHQRYWSHMVHEDVF